MGEFTHIESILTKSGPLYKYRDSLNLCDICADIFLCVQAVESYCLYSCQKDYSSANMMFIETSVMGGGFLQLLADVNR